MRIICMTTDSDGCHGDCFYDNRHWLLLFGLFIWQPTLTAAMWNICMTTDTDGCHDWYSPWQPWLTVAKQKFALATMADGCQAEFCLGNHDWRCQVEFFLGNQDWWLPSRILPRQPWLTVAKENFALANMTDGCQAEIGLGNHDWRWPSKNWAWQPWLSYSWQIVMNLANKSQIHFSLFKVNPQNPKFNLEYLQPLKLKCSTLVSD